MRKVAWLLLLMSATTALAAPPLGSPNPTSTGDAKSIRSLVSLIEDVQVPVQEAGVLATIDVREGSQVEAGALLGRLDDGQVRMQKVVAEAERNVTQERASDDVEIRAAEGARDVAQTTYNAHLEANRRVPGTHSKIEMLELELKVKLATLQIEKCKHDQKVAKFQSEAAAAKVDLADIDIKRREIRAPVNGEVIEIVYRPGEWVEPGKPVFRVVRRDRMRIEGFVNAADYSPSEIGERPVRVDVQLARGRTATFTGRIVFVHPRLQPGGGYRVWAEVDNRQEAGQWLLQPGAEGQMSIDVVPLANRPESIPR